MFSRDNPHHVNDGHAPRNIQLNYEKMRKLVISEGYDKVFVVEEDMIIPKDALKKLLEVDAPIVSGLYSFRHGINRPNIFKSGVNESGWEGLMTWEEANTGETVTISGGCMGCLLVDKSALMDFSFETAESSAPDRPFMMHCNSHGINQVARLDVICGHQEINGTSVWPDKNNKQGYKIERATQ